MHVVMYVIHITVHNHMGFSQQPLTWTVVSLLLISSCLPHERKWISSVPSGKTILVGQLDSPFCVYGTSNLRSLVCWLNPSSTVSSYIATRGRGGSCVNTVKPLCGALLYLGLPGPHGLLWAAPFCLFSSSYHSNWHCCTPSGVSETGHVLQKMNLLIWSWIAWSANSKQ